MKKRIMTLLMAAIMVGGVLTGCGSEKEVTEPNNDEEVVVEESNVAESAPDETVSEENNVADEEVIEEFTFADLWNAASDCSENGRLSINPIGQITIFNAKLPASEPIIRDAGEGSVTKFDMYTVNTALSDNNLQKGRRYDDYYPYYENPEEHDEYLYWIGALSLEETESDYVYTGDPDHERVKVEPDPNQPVYTLNASFIDDNNDGVADKIVLSYDSDGVTNIIGYIGNLSVRNQGYALSDAGKYMWAFETPITENGEDFVYYTVLEVPCSVSEDSVNFVIGSPDDMTSKTNVNVIE